MSDTRSEMATKVRRGATLLDGEYPGWHNEINTGTLALWSAQYCILGQLYGTYSRGMDALEIEVGFDFGFNVLWSESYHEATDLWLNEIVDRKQK